MDSNELTQEHLQVLSKAFREQSSDEGTNEKLKSYEDKMIALQMAEMVRPLPKKRGAAEIVRELQPLITVIVLTLMVLASVLGIDLSNIRGLIP